MIAGILCDKYKVSHHTFAMPGIYLNDSSYTYTYIKNDTLFFSRDSVFNIYAVFNAQIGDSISTDMYSFCGPNHFTVDSLGTTLINNDTLKVMYLTPTVFGYATLPLRLIEKIGYDQQMFEPWPCLVDMPFSSPLRCYNNSSGFLFQSNIVPYCDYILSSYPNEFKKQEITLFPNPTTKNFTLITPLNTKQIQITNSLGQTIQKISTQNQTQFQLSIPDNGIYFVHIITDKQSITKKIIVNH